jgi:hypothetical protein
MKVAFTRFDNRIQQLAHQLTMQLEAEDVQLAIKITHQYDQRTIQKDPSEFLRQSSRVSHENSRGVQRSRSKDSA